MRTKNLIRTALLVVPVIAALAIPGEAASIGAPDGTNLKSATTPLPQASFGLLADPHVEPVLYFEPVGANWRL
jgi:hypothetical protein